MLAERGTGEGLPFPVLALTVALMAAGLTGCLSGGGGEVLQQAGSSTVFPIAEAWAAELSEQGTQVSVQGGGSGAGASKLCNGEIHIADMSRTLKESEIERCRANGVEPQVWKVAFDGITVAVNNQNPCIESLTVAQLEHIWRPDDPARTWDEVDPACPAEEIVLFGPDSDSGTYEYFNEAILGEETAPRDDYTPSANDNVLVEGVAQQRWALGYFGFAYYDESRGRLNAVAIQDGPEADPVEPSRETIGDGTYTPLSRPLYMVTDGKPENGTTLQAYFEYAMGPGQGIVPDVGYVPLDEATLETQRGWL